MEGQARRDIGWARRVYVRLGYGLTERSLRAIKCIAIKYSETQLRLDSCAVVIIYR